MRLIQVDAFTDRVFSGNPAAVCLLTESRPASWMQAVAREMNLSETAFVREQEDGYALRWFTPAVEVDLCGHATLAAAHVLWEEKQLDVETAAHFHTRSGLLTAWQQGNWITMDFPAKPEKTVESLSGLGEALGAQPIYVGSNGMDYLALLSDEAAVRTLHPDLHCLSQLETRGLIVTAASSTEGYDFVSRFFAPQVGVPEDPVTGSAHCCLAPFWQKRLNKQDMTGYQASARGGIVRVGVRGDRVHLAGRAVTVLRGELSV